MVCNVLPNTVAMFALLLRHRDTGYGLLMDILVTWIPTVNPVGFTDVHYRKSFSEGLY